MFAKLKFLLLSSVVSLLLGCSEPSQITAHSLHQFSDALVLTGQISKDANYVMLVVEGPNLAIWRTQDKQVAFSLSESQLPKNIRAVKLDVEQKLLLVAGDNILQFWRLSDGVLIDTIKADGADVLARVSSLSLAKKGQMIGIGFTDGSISLYSRTTGKIKQFMPHTSNVIAIEFFANNERVISASHDGSVKGWHTHTGDVHFEKVYSSRVSTLAVSEALNQAFVSDGLKTQQILGADNGEVLAQLDYVARFKWFRKALFIPSQPFIVTSSTKSELSLWNRISGKEQRTWHIDAHSLGTMLLDMVIVDGQLHTLSSEGILETWQLDSILPNT